MWLPQSVNASAASSKRILPVFEQSTGSAYSRAFVHICVTIEAMALCIDPTDNFSNVKRCQWRQAIRHLAAAVGGENHSLVEEYLGYIMADQSHKSRKSRDQELADQSRQLLRPGQ